MIVLALDTATAATTAALVGEGLRIESTEVDARRHAEALPVIVRALLADSGVGRRDLDLIACGVGPGPFTGLRVGVAFARAMAIGLGVPVVGACTLDVIASGSTARGPLTVVTRHRRAEVAWATYEKGDGIERTGGPLIAPESSFERLGTVIGDIADVDVPAQPSSADLGALVLARRAAGEPFPADIPWPEDAAGGSGAPAERILGERAAAGLRLLPALPLYLRRPDAVPA